MQVQSYDNYKAIPNSATAMTWLARSGTYAYTFKARYIQTAPTVGAGLANATMVVNLDYQ